MAGGEHTELRCRGKEYQMWMGSPHVTSFRGWYMFTALGMSWFWHHGLIKE